MRSKRHSISTLALNMVIKVEYVLACTGSWQARPLLELI